MTKKLPKAIEVFIQKKLRDMGDDCVCQRTSPGTPVGEHIHCFCGCQLDEIARAMAEHLLSMPVVDFFAAMKDFASVGLGGDE